MDYVSRLSPPPEKLATPGWQNPYFAEFNRLQVQPRAKHGSAM